MHGKVRRVIKRDDDGNLIHIVPKKAAIGEARILGPYVFSPASEKALQQDSVLEQPCVKVVIGFELKILVFDAHLSLLIARVDSGC